MDNIHAGILLISTRKYKVFVQPLIDQLAQYFLGGYKRTVFVFTDEPMELNGHGMNVQQWLIPSYKWPYPTLMRYAMFDDNREELKKCTHLTYMDVDMAVVAPIGNELLVDEGLVVVRHPGYYKNNGWGNGDNENPKESTSYMVAENRKHYFCGGVQSGTAEAYLELSKVLSANIKKDEENGVMAVWHDETHYNKYVNENFDKIPMKELTPSMCMVEQINLRELWGINDLPVQIVALAKNHSEIRN